MTIEERLDRLEQKIGIIDDKQWPPFGVPVEVSDNSNEWYPHISCGGRNLMSGLDLTDYDYWRYYQLTGEDWKHAPEWAKYRVVDSWGDIWWAKSQFLVGDVGTGESTIVDVQVRPND